MIINKNGINEKIHISYFNIKKIVTYDYIKPLCNYKINNILLLLKENQNSKFEIKYISDKIHTIIDYINIKSCDDIIQYIVMDNKIIYLEQLIECNIYIECPICIDNINNMITLPCNHSFCSKCINSHIDISGTYFFNCPLCRKQYNKSQYCTNNSIYTY